MLELKPISKEGIPRALEKADRYRLLNEPSDAESICLDILATDPENQRALIILILAVSDQFATDGFQIQPHEVNDLLSRVRSDYERAYYTGVMYERRAKATRSRRVPHSMASEWFAKAMKSYEVAAAIRPTGNEDALLRWNSCARTVRYNPELQEAEEERVEPYLE